MNIGEQIKEARRRKKMSQDELGDLIHMSRTAVSHWETGRSPVSPEQIAKLEEILQCQFEIEQEQAVEAPASSEKNAAEAIKNKIVDAFRKKVPVWLCAAIAGGIFAVMLAIMLCVTSNLQKQIDAFNRQPAAPYSLAWFQETDNRQDGKAFITITPDQNPVMAIPNPDGGERNIWYYQISFVEQNGVPFTVEEIIFQPFNGDLPKNAITENAERISSAWGDNTIPANGVQYLGAGMPVQAITQTGIIVKGTDANGNDLVFRGIVSFSQDLAE